MVWLIVSLAIVLIGFGIIFGFWYRDNKTEKVKTHLICAAFALLISCVLGGFLGLLGVVIGESCMDTINKLAEQQSDINITTIEVNFDTARVLVISSNKECLQYNLKYVTLIPLNPASDKSIIEKRKKHPASGKNWVTAFGQDKPILFGDTSDMIIIYYTTDVTIKYIGEGGLLTVNVDQGAN